jgi:D-sedoheptulose 7-phosphate isomerase
MSSPTPFSESIPTAFSQSYRERLLATLATIDTEGVAKAIEWIQETRDSDHAIFVAGNGGSAATAAHFVCDMVKGASTDKPARFRIVALGQNLPTLTAYANDVSYGDALVEELRNFARPGDLYMAISGSGNSPNVVRAMEFANERGCRTLALTGRDGGKLGRLAQLNIHVPEGHMGRIEDAHHVICHMICYCFMEQPEMTPAEAARAVAKQPA